MSKKYRKFGEGVRGFVVPPRKKVVLRGFAINEISAVDTPAMEGALVTIMKRHNIPTYSEAVFDAAGDGYDIIKTVTDDPDIGNHIVVEKNGRREMFFFEGAVTMISKEAVQKATNELSASLAGLLQKNGVKPLQEDNVSKITKSDGEDGRVDLINRFCVSKSKGGQVTEEQINELENKLASAIAREYQSSPTDARQSARLMLEDAAVFNKLAPRVEKWLDADLQSAAQQGVKKTVASLREANPSLRRVDAMHQMRDTNKSAPAGFEARVAEIRGLSKGMKRTDAIQQARRQYPEEFAAWQG